MKKVLKSICCFIICAFCLQSILALADSDFENWKKEFYQQALKSGVSKRILDKTVPKMHLVDRIIKLDTTKPEYISNFYTYTRTRLTDKRIEGGRAMLKKYPTWLKRVEKEYGVPRSYLLALWGMETNYGTFMGNVDMLDSLASLAYHPRRRKFFTNELIAYLKILEQENSVAPKTGSWDGGFGNFQFMPSTFLAYAVDGDGNGRRDIVNNMPDAFASAANYLSKMGWHTDEPWGREVIVPEDLDWSHIHRREHKTVADWVKLGIRPKHIDSFPVSEKDIIAEWHAPMGNSGPIFLTYPNFKIIMRWNKLSLYAISVGLLADLIEARYERPTPPDDCRPFKTAEIICLQDALKKQGYHEGGSDGMVGPKTRHAIRLYQEAKGLLPDAYPNHDLLTKLECKND